MLLKVVARELNRTIEESTLARRQAAKLNGKSLAIDVAGLPIVLRLTVNDGALAITVNDVDSASVSIKAPPSDLVRLTKPNALSELKRTGGELNGEVGVAEDFAELLRLARPELEEELARWVGDIAARDVATVLSNLTHWAEYAFASVSTASAEYLHEEAKLAPSTEELEAFGTAVEDLRDDVERVEQRLLRLSARLGKVLQ